MSKLLSLILAAVLASPCAAATGDLTGSAGGAAKPKHKSAFFWSSASPGSIPLQRPTVGVGRMLGEGKPLEVTLWGGAGAVAGTVLGPGGTLVGAAVGAGLGLLYSLFVVPHNGPAPK